jgi:hypothetical protein
MIDYSRAIIDVVKSNYTNQVFIGSTTQSLTRIKNKHCREWGRYILNEGIQHQPIFDILNYEDAYFQVIEEYPCNSRKELNERVQLIRAMYY